MDERTWLAALGPLTPLYDDAAVSEIMVDAPDRVYVERRGRLEDAGVTFSSREALRVVIEALLGVAGSVLAPQQTTARAHLPDGSRFLAVLPPTAPQGPCLVIRRLPQRTLTWEDMFQFGALSREVHQLLLSALRAHVGLLVAGGAGGGKTTIANLLAGSIPSEERVIVAEEVRELDVRHPRSLALESGTPATLSFSEVLATASRMRPDWLIVGEPRGPEALEILQVLSAGFPGIMSVYGTSPEDALARLEALCLMANSGLGLAQIRPLIASAFRVISFQERLPDGSRKLTQLVELGGIEEGRYVLQPLFRYDRATSQFDATGAQPGWERA